jgi:hypothetical protein
MNLAIHTPEAAAAGHAYNGELVYINFNQEASYGYAFSVLTTCCEWVV